MSTQRCPACDGRIFNPRRGTCEFCEVELPSELVLDGPEKAEQAATDRARLRASMQRMKDQEAEERRARARMRRQAGGFGGYIHF